QSLECTVNVQHDCDRNRCSIVAKPAVQEKELMPKVKDEVVHRGNLADRVLNTAQMRDAKFLQ
ncbi:hypothetical protein F5879DRAFT_782128, partial [Lentinula edodes]